MEICLAVYALIHAGRTGGHDEGNRRFFANYAKAPKRQKSVRMEQKDVFAITTHNLHVKATHQSFSPLLLEINLIL